MVITVILENKKKRWYKQKNKKNQNKKINSNLNIFPKQYKKQL